MFFVFRPSLEASDAEATSGGSPSWRHTHTKAHWGEKMCDPLVVAGIGIALEHASPSSDGFCVVREITRGGPVDVSGYERSNGEVRRVQVGDWLLRVNDILCQDMPRDEVKRYIVGPLGTKVVVVFASRRDNKAITVHLERFRAPLQPNVAGPSKQFNHIEVHTRHHHDPGGFSNSQRVRDRVEEGGCGMYVSLDHFLDGAYSPTLNQTPHSSPDFSTV